jgi:hypothetical protein
MKNGLIVSCLFLLIAGDALAGSGYERCLKEEKALKAKEASDCSGLRYLLDPSSCFRTRKDLKEYTDGKCAAIGAAEQVDFSASPAVPEKKASPVSAPPKPFEPLPASAVPANKPAVAVTATPLNPVESNAPVPVTTISQLQEENARLKSENLRLKNEIEQLRTGTPH